MKKMITLGLVACLSALSSMTAFAGHWEHDGYWYYLDDNGCKVENTWVGNYYVGIEGQMYKNAITPDGYLVGEDGAWIEAKPGNEDEVYWLYMLVHTTPYYDAVPYHAEYWIDDFNHDGVKDLLLGEYIDRGETGYPTCTMQLYTIRNGKVEKTGAYSLDEATEEYCRYDTKKGYLYQFNDKNILYYYTGVAVHFVGVIDDNLNFIDGANYGLSYASYKRVGEPVMPAMDLPENLSYNRMTGEIYLH